MKKISLFLFIVVGTLQAQKIDTVYVNSKNINIANLKYGELKYLVSAKDLVKDSLAYLTICNRNISKKVINNTTLISIDQKWQGQEETALTSTSYVDASSFNPVSQLSWNIRTDSLHVDFKNGTFKISEKAKKILPAAHQKGMEDAFSLAKKQQIYNWHLDLELFSLINYKENTVFAINFYDPGSLPPEVQYYTVAGVEALESINNSKITCWLLTKNKNGKITEKIWVDKQSKLVLKVEQNFGSIVRIKSRIL